jgi:serine/threonine-protein kinase
MGLLDTFRLNQAITTILATPRGDPSVAAAAIQIREMGAAAVPRLLKNLARDQHGTLSELLGEVVTNVTLQVLIKEGLLNDDPRVSAGARSALAHAQKIDANRFFELYITYGGDLSEVADLLVSKRSGLNAKSMLRLLDLGMSDAGAGLFKLIDQLATESMVGPLIGFLKSVEWTGRIQIARIITRFPNPQVRDALVHLLGDAHRLVREAALESLGDLGLPVPPRPVCALLRDADLVVQAKAIETAVKLNDPKCIGFLLEVLQDESEHARRAAVEVLNGVGDANAVKDLMVALKDQDWWVRDRAADALGAIGGPKVIDAVLQLLGTEDEFMRRTAMEILNTTKDKRAFDYLVAALNDPDWWVRERAVDALANMGDKRATPYLIAILPGEDQATVVVIRALAQLADSRAVDAIIAKLSSRDEAIQREAVAALGMLARPEHMPVVLRSLQEFNPATAEIRVSANAVISRLTARSKGAGSVPARPLAKASPAVIETVVVSERSLKAANANVDQPLQRTTPIETGECSEEHTTDLSIRKKPRMRATGTLADLANVAPGMQLAGRYLVNAELGRGGFGIVLRVTDQIIGEDIALKLIDPRLIQDQENITRFLQEVRYSRRVTHENVIRVHDFLEIDGLYGISMEHFASQPLSRHIRRGLHQRPVHALRMLRDMARGIRSAHQANVMHRDLKPANILVNEAELLKIVDFGLASACSHANSRLTRTGTLIGTPSYMSPEQGRGVDIDYRTDIYSLGVVMYELFTGTVPYAADNPLTVLHLHLHGKKDPPSARNPLISPDLEAVILKAMAVKPADRYQSVGELLAALDALELSEAA